MISISRATLLVVAVLAVTPLVVQSHHGQAMYDEKEITVQGVVKEFQYTNPHSWLLVDVTSKDGSVTTWGFEAEGPNTLLQKGIHKSDLTPGTKVTVTTRPMKNGQPAGMWITLTRGDGVVLDPRMRPAVPPATPPPAAPTK